MIEWCSILFFVLESLFGRPSGRSVMMNIVSPRESSDLVVETVDTCFL